MKWTTKNDYQAMISANRLMKNVYASACGSACGAGEDKPEEKPTACGSACGAGDK